MLDEVLVALQLGRGIAADVLVVVGRHGGVKNVHGEVQDTVLRVFIGLDHLVHGALGEGLVEVLGGGEVVGVEVALAYSEEVHQRQGADEHGGQLLASLGHVGPEEEAGRCQDQQQGDAGVGLEEGDAVGDEGVHEDILHLRVGSAGEGAEHAGGEPGQQAEAAGKAEGPPEGLHEALAVVFLLGDAVQGHEAQQRQRHLQHHQRHGHRTELIVQRQVVVAEFGERHEVAAHRHENGDDRGRHQPPFLPSLVKAEAQHEEEEGDGAHVHGTGRERLGTPVERQVLGRFLQVLLAGALEELDGLALVGIHSAGGGPAVEVRDVA